MFKFRLQRVLDLRVQKEQEVATRLAEARSAEERAREACEAIERVRDEGAYRAAEAQATHRAVGQLQNLRMLVDHLTHHATAARQHAEAAGAHVTRTSAEFTAAFQERRVLDRLRERDLESWRSAETHADRARMDAVALSRFVRAPKPEGETK